MRLKPFALLFLIITLGSLAFAPSLCALPNGTLGADCSDCHFAGENPLGPGVQDTMFAAPIASKDAPKLDGRVDAVWNEAKEISIPVKNGWSASEVTIKALFTNDTIYFLARWKDPTLSDRMQPWKKMGDAGPDTWLHVPAKPQDGESETDSGWFFGSTRSDYGLRQRPPAGAAYEDSFAIIWGARDTTATIANVAGFKTAGCAILCHISPGKGTSNDTKYAQNQGEVADLWHWKLVRTGTAGFVDDRFVDATRPSPDAPDAGQKSDPGDAYEENAEATNAGAPPWIAPGQPVAVDTPDTLDQYFIPFDKRQRLASSIAREIPAGREVAGTLVRPPAGDRGDIAAQKETTSTTGYDPSSDTWTLEFSRKLTTAGKTVDIQFDNLQDTYYFGVSTFDNAQIEHSFSKSVYALEFLPAVEITFRDTKKHWAQQEIQRFANDGIVIGYADGTFRPDYPVTRAEFSKIIMEELDLPQITLAAPTFNDVKPDAWFFGYIEGAVDAGFISGYGDGTFRPNTPITRQEAARILGFALDIDEDALVRSRADIEDTLHMFPDASAISPWAVPLFAQAADQGLFKGYKDVTLRPKRDITRAEAVAIVHRGR